MPTRSVVTHYDAWRVALEAAPFSVVHAAVDGVVGEHFLVTVTLWPGLEAWEWRIGERVRTALRVAVDDGVDVEVLVRPAGGWACGRPKRPFETREAALEHAGRSHQHAYRCSFCGAWHLAKDRPR